MLLRRSLFALNKCIKFLWSQIYILTFRLLITLTPNLLKITLSHQQIRINHLYLSILIINPHKYMRQSNLIIMRSRSLQKCISRNRCKYNISYLISIKIYPLQQTTIILLLQTHKRILQHHSTLTHILKQPINSLPINLNLHYHKITILSNCSCSLWFSILFFNLCTF